uniref:RRM domain-containing protein n=1 Tax=Cyprinodon variegatus TaxID=28743 RepID=A0A3Q2E1K7_CYPVA
IEKIAPQKRVFISLPRKYMAALSKHYPLDHGLLIMNLGHNINEGYLRAYFKEYGDITMCKIKTCSNSSKDKLAFVRFRTADEADRADWAGPHDIRGAEIKVKRVVSPKVNIIYFT